MPKFGVPSAQLQQPAWPPPGVYEFAVEKFKPDHTKDKGSINLNPSLIIVNTPGNFLCDDKECVTKHSENGQPGHAFNGSKPAFISGNQKAMFIVEAMVHALGLNMVEEVVDVGGGQMESYSNVPGDFSGQATDPKTWAYTGPITEKNPDGSYKNTGKLEVNLVDAIRNGQIVGKKNNVKQFFCKVQDCVIKHPTELK